MFDANCCSAIFLLTLLSVLQFGCSFRHQGAVFQSSVMQRSTNCITSGHVLVILHSRLPQVTYSRFISRLGGSYNRNPGAGNIITSTANSKVKLLRALERKKQRDKTGLILLEGHRQIIDAINSGIRPSLILYTARAMAAPLGAELSDVIYGSDMVEHWDVEETTDSVMKSLTDTVNSQGVVAAFFKPAPRQSLNGLPRAASDNTTTTNRFILVLDHVADPGNMGTLMRTAWGLGVDAIIVVGGCDPWASKVLRASMGTCLQLPLLEFDEWGDVTECINSACTDGTLEKKALQIIIADADTVSQENKPPLLSYEDADFSQPTLLVIGSEATGVSREAYELPAGHCIRVRIPMVRQLESFNAAVAGSILIAKASTQRQD